VIAETKATTLDSVVSKEVREGRDVSGKVGDGFEEVRGSTV
jgi:hypothetical protein